VKEKASKVVGEGDSAGVVSCCERVGKQINVTVKSQSRRPHASPPSSFPISSEFLSQTCPQDDPDSICSLLFPYEKYTNDISFVPDIQDLA
jgi:hypothetical protein